MAGDSGEKYEKKWVSPNRALRQAPCSAVMLDEVTSDLYFKTEARTSALCGAEVSLSHYFGPVSSCEDGFLGGAMSRRL